MAGADDDAGGAARRALRAFETETIVARLRDLDFYDANRDVAWWMLSANPSLTAEAILALPDKPWVVAAMSRNPRISRADAERICAALGARRGQALPVPCEFADRPEVQFADVAGASPRSRDTFARRNPNMTLDLYLEHRELGEALANPAVANARALRERPDFPWANHARTLVRNPAFGDEALRELEALAPELFAKPGRCDHYGLGPDGLPIWDWDRYSWNAAVSWETVARHRDKPWDMCGLARNPAVLDYERWREMPEGIRPGGRAWCWCGLSANPAFATRERVRAHPDWPWKKEYIAPGPEGFAWEDLPALRGESGASEWPRPDPRDVRIWCKVRLFGDAERDAWARRWFAARRIQRAWLRAYYTPGAGVWRRRMARQFAELGAPGAAQGAGPDGVAAAAAS